LPDTLGLLKLPAKPARENFQAARWYLTLFHFTGTMEYRAVAESTLQSMMTSLQPLPIGLAGLALDQWFRVPVHIAVVGHSNDSGTTSLLLESRRLYYPGKIVKRIDPKNEEPKWGEIIFPFDGRPVAFVCTDRLCSPPAFQAEKLRPNLAEIFTLLQNPPLQ